MCHVCAITNNHFTDATISKYRQEGADSNNPNWTEKNVLKYFLKQSRDKDAGSVEGSQTGRAEIPRAKLDSVQVLDQELGLDRVIDWVRFNVRPNTL